MKVEPTIMIKRKITIKKKIGFGTVPLNLNLVLTLNLELFHQ